MIKKLVKLSFFMALFIFAIACGKSAVENTPEKVAEAYVEAMYKTDIKTLKELKKPGDVIENVDEAALEKVLKSMTAEVENAGGLESVSSQKAEIDSTGVKAMVVVTVKAVNGSDSEIKCKMEQSGGKWYFSSIGHGMSMDNFHSVHPIKKQ